MDEYELIKLESEICDSIEKEREKLEQSIEERKKSIGTKEERPNDKYYLKQNMKKLGLVNQLYREFSDLRFMRTTPYELPSEIEAEINELKSMLSDEQASKLKEIANKCMEPHNKDKKEKLKTNVENIYKLIKQLGWDNYHIYREYSGSISLTAGIKTIKGAKLCELRHKKFDYTTTLEEPGATISYGQGRLIERVEELIEEGKINGDKSTESIIKNFSTIKETYAKQKVLEELRSNLWHLIPSLKQESKESEVDFTPLIKFLEKVKNETTKEIKKCESYLSKFNFNVLEQEVKNIEEKEKEEKEERNKEQSYINLSYSLEKTLQENPEDSKKIEEIKEQLRIAAQDLTNSQIMDLKGQGVQRYHDEERKLKEEVKSEKAKIQARDDAYYYAMKNLTSMAIQELERNKAFDDYEYRNGDIRSTMTPEIREAMIQRTIEKMKRIATMTPEERGLEDMKRSGQIPSYATLESLPYQQIQDLRLGYRDESYGYVGAVRQSMKEIKEVTNTVYKDYIRYLTGEEDKSKALKFREFAKNLGYDMTEEMVDEEIRGIIR